MPLSLSIAARVSNDSHSDNQLPNSGADRKRGCAPAYRGRGTNFPQASAEIPASLGNWGIGRPPSLARRSPHLVPTRNWGVVVDAARAWAPKVSVQRVNRFKGGRRQREQRVVHGEKLALGLKAETIGVSRNKSKAERI